MTVEEKKEEMIESAKRKWNAEADGYNQWPALGEREKDALVVVEEQFQEDVMIMALWETAFEAFKQAEEPTNGKHLTRNACDAMHDIWPLFGCVMHELRERVKKQK